MKLHACTAHACHCWLCCQVYGPNNLGKLTAGGHPRRLAQQEQEQPQHEQHGAQMGSQNGAQAKPNTKPQAQQQQQQAQDKNPDDKETPASAQVVPQNLVSHGQISKEQLTQVQRSQEQHSQGGGGEGGLKEQDKGGGAQTEGTVGLAAQAVPIIRADCFTDFNPPTVEQYQEVRGVRDVHADAGTHM